MTGQRHSEGTKKSPGRPRLDPVTVEVPRMRARGGTNAKRQCFQTGCSDQVHGRGLCRKHYGRYYRSSGFEKSKNLAGSWIDHNGYVRVYVAESKSGWKHQHRIVMEEHLSRPLTKDESVHHINGDRADNRIENLQLRQRWHSQGQSYRCMDCGSNKVEAVPL